jgi:NAD(P)H-hydrate repair Nnr-like enzyme with NAD(P)H-hydrate epimerase domain
LQGRERELNVQQNISDSGRWWTAAPRAIVCWAMALFIAKVVMIDTVLGWGVTPPLKGLVADAFQAVIVMWFGGRTIEKVARIWRPR